MKNPFITTSVTNKLNRKLPFVYLSPSLDRDGGAQFTYSFWFKTEPGSNFDFYVLCVETRPEQISSTSRKKHLTGYQTSCSVLIRAKMESGGDLTFTSQVNVNDDYNKVATHTVKRVRSRCDSMEPRLCIIRRWRTPWSKRGVMCKIWYNLIPQQQFFQDPVSNQTEVTFTSFQNSPAATVETRIPK
jgi:hypothetical protein